MSIQAKDSAEYFIDGLAEGIKAAAQCFGSGAKYIWPWSGIMAIALLVACAVAIYLHATKARSPLFASAGLALMLTGLFVLAITIGMGRAVFGPNAGFSPRYAQMVSPIPIVALFVLDQFASVRLQSYVRVVLFAVMCILYWPSSRILVPILDARMADGYNLEGEVKRCVPVPKLAQEYGSRWMFSPKNFEEKMQMLANAHMAIYRDNPPPRTSC